MRYLKRGPGGGVGISTLGELFMYDDSCIIIHEP